MNGARGDLFPYELGSDLEPQNLPNHRVEMFFCPQNVCCVDIFEAIGMENMNIAS